MGSTLARSALVAALAAPAMGDPVDLPLLEPGVRLAVIYTGDDPVSGPAAAGAWGVMFSAPGIDSYELFAGWSSLQPNAYANDLTGVTQQLDTIVAASWQPYLAVATINTNLLDVPAEFRMPGSTTAFLPGVGFDNRDLRDSFLLMLSELVPTLVARDGFYLSLGNEVDIWLAANPDQIAPFAGFIAEARQLISVLNPDLAVGVTLTHHGLDNPAIAGPLLPLCDALAVTYYPMENGLAQDPGVVEGDIAAMVQAAGGKSVLIQEAGYPSGWAEGSDRAPAIDGSYERQRQFIVNLRRAVEREPSIRFVSVLQLADWSDAVLDGIQDDYGLYDPAFREFLGTLGLMEPNGTPKPAYYELLKWAGGCPIDADANGSVNTEDLYRFQSAPYDANADGFVDDRDAGCLETFLRRRE